jgi:hypothetical protein
MIFFSFQRGTRAVLDVFQMVVMPAIPGGSGGCPRWNRGGAGRHRRYDEHTRQHQQPIHVPFYVEMTNT